MKNTNASQDREIELAEQAASDITISFTNLLNIISDLDEQINSLSDQISELTEEKRVLEEDNEELRRIIEKLKE